jgi:hypothetical protein
MPPRRHRVRCTKGELRGCSRPCAVARGYRRRRHARCATVDEERGPEGLRGGRRPRAASSPRVPLPRRPDLPRPRRLARDGQAGAVALRAQQAAGAHGGSRPGDAVRRRRRDYRGLLAGRRARGRSRGQRPRRRAPPRQLRAARAQRGGQRLSQRDGEATGARRHGPSRDACTRASAPRGTRSSPGWRTARPAPSRCDRSRSARYSRSSGSRRPTWSRSTSKAPRSRSCAARGARSPRSRTSCSLLDLHPHLGVDTAEVEALLAALGLGFYAVGPPHARLTHVERGTAEPMARRAPGAALPV